jgi:HAD superfamily hydrolase (TIGR01490 family)
LRSGWPPLGATDERDAPPVASADEMSDLLHLNQTGHSAAFFDLDRTLISGSSAFVFGVSAWRADMLPSKQFARDAVSAIAFKVRGDKGGDVVAKIRERILGAVKGLSQDSLVGLNETIVPKLLERVRPESKQLLDLHRRQGRATYIISASPKELVEPLAMALGMTDGIGTVSEIVDGHYTGGLVGPFCYGEGKVEAIVEIAKWEGFDLRQCYAYSDSISDLPMLEAVGHPVAVNPDGRLNQIALQRGWPIVIFARRTKRVIRRTTAGIGTAALAAGSFSAGWRLSARRR